VGTFTEQALRTLPAAERADLVPLATVTAALDAVRNGEVSGAVVPLENSVEGAVPITLDGLATGEPLVITREVTLPVQFALLRRPEDVETPVRSILTHPHAAAQCRGWIAKHHAHAEVVHAGSTAQAAELVSAPDSPHDAAVAAPVAVEHYRLAVAATDIGDHSDARTRFVLVSRPGPLPPRTGADKTSLVAFIHDDHPGALMELLDQFALRGVNLTRIESRPTGAALGNYCFSIDAEGHLADARVGEALMGLRRICADVRFLGSYPREDGVAASVRAGLHDADFTDATSWLARLRDPLG
jgi:prephenate dehydratase